VAGPLTTREPSGRRLLSEATATVFSGRAISLRRRSAHARQSQKRRKSYADDGVSSFRLLLDLRRPPAMSSRPVPAWPQEAKPAASAVASVPILRLPLSRDGTKRIIVLDPRAWRNRSPGRMVNPDCRSKSIVLAVARELRTALEANTGRYQRATLTRDSDVFIPLRERVNIARARRGETSIVSLHADIKRSPARSEELPFTRFRKTHRTAKRPSSRKWKIMSGYHCRG